MTSLMDEPVLDLEAAFAAEVARLVVARVDFDDVVQFYVIRDDRTVLHACLTEQEAQIRRARELIVILDDLRSRLVRPLLWRGG